jgi:phosphoglycerol transferase MdoB-like AlkP superfamily enzyme
MIGAGVYLILIIVFFSIAIAIFYYFISYWVYGSNCNTIRIILSVRNVYWPVRVLDVLHQKGSEINNLAVCDIVVNQRNNSLR